MTEALQSPGWVLLAWVLAGLISMFGVLTTVEIAGIVSGSGGPYAYLNRIYGRAMAFTYGWASFTAIQSASIASIAYVFAQSLNAVVAMPRLPLRIEQSFNLFGVFYPLENIGVKLAAASLICVLAAINYRGVKQGGAVSTLIMITVMCSLALIVFVGLFCGGGSFSNLTTNASGYQAKTFSLSAMFTAMVGAFWAYEGWITLGFMAGEVKNPTRNVPLALVFGTLIVIAIYLLVNLTYLYVMPTDEILRGFIQHDAQGNVILNPNGEIVYNDNYIPAVEMMRKIGGSAGAILISLLIIITTAGCTNMTIMAASRIYYAMAADGVFFRKAAHIHPVYNTPGNSLIYQACVSSLLVFSGSFDQLTEMLVFVQFIFYGAVAVGVRVLRRREPDLPRPIRAFGYPIIPALYILMCGYLVLNSLISDTRNSVFGLTLVAAGIPLFLYWNHNSPDSDNASPNLERSRPGRSGD
jgi:APA family basic amino acid/polyamine antiporter